MLNNDKDITHKKNIRTHPQQNAVCRSSGCSLPEFICCCSCWLVGTCSMLACVVLVIATKWKTILLLILLNIPMMMMTIQRKQYTHPRRSIRCAYTLVMYLTCRFRPDTNIITLQKLRVFFDSEGTYPRTSTHTSLSIVTHFIHVVYTGDIRSISQSIHDIMQYVNDDANADMPILEACTILVSFADIMFKNETTQQDLFTASHGTNTQDDDGDIIVVQS